MDKIDELLTRGIANIIPSKNELEKKLKSSDKLNIYLGIDPTATKIHLGHALILRILQKFAELRHNVTFLIGDFTALVGDTSDKDSERPILTKEEIEENFQTYKKQAEKILDFEKVKVRHNSEWLAKLSLEEFLKISNIFSLNDFISRELIKKRLSEGRRVGLSETFYPLLQAYDSYNLKTDVQVGGTDQTFNMQAGRSLIKNLENRESFALTTEFLMGTDGRKMSKSWGNAIWLDDEPFEMYRKVMSINDEMILNYFMHATNLPLNQIPSKEEIGKNPLDLKKKLADTIVSELHSKEEAGKAAEEFKKVVQEKDLSNVNRINLNWPPISGASMSHVLSNELHVFGSVSEAKRVTQQGGINIAGTVVKDPNTDLSKLLSEEETPVVIGGKRFYTIKKK